MPNATIETEDALAKHQVYILRVEGSQAREVNLTIDKSVPELIGILTLWMQNARFGQQITILQENQFTKLRKEVARVRLPAIRKAQEEYEDDLGELVEHELEYSADLFAAILPFTVFWEIPKSEVVTKTLTTTASYNGATVSQWFQNLADADVDRIVKQVRFGVTQGMSDAEVIASVVGTKPLDFKDGVLNVTRNSTNRLVKTITNGIANDARSSVIKANDEFFLGERYTAILDSKTSLICLDLDGTLVKPGEGPRPPQHPNCRSFMVPIFDAEAIAGELNEKIEVDDGKRAKKDLNFRDLAKDKAGKKWEGMTTLDRRRAILNAKRKWVKEKLGKIADPMSVDQWLKRQTKSFQDELLGPTRAQLWRDGKAGLDKFVDRSGKIMTVEQLRRLEG